MSNSSSFLVEKLALQYDIDPYAANICIQSSTKDFRKEVISTDSGYAYYSTARNLIFVNVRITKSMTKRIKYLFGKKYRVLKQRLKIFIICLEFKIFRSVR